jgi:hypothetical protein
VLALLLGSQGFCLAEGEGSWRVWFDARFLAPAVQKAVPGAEKTVFSGGVWDGEQLVGFERRRWVELGWSWEAFEAAARRNAVLDFASVGVRFQRDKRRVIEFAELRSDQPLVASAVLDPGLGTRFSETLGEVLFLAVPSRYKAYVFPQHGGDPSQYSQMVWAAYRETAQPVSMELFELRQGKFRAVGTFEP